MKKRFIISLFAILCSFGTARSQEQLNEFVVNVDEKHNPMTLYSSYGATPNDGVVIVNSTIPGLEFNIPAAPRRIRTVPDKKKNRYVLIIQPNDNNYKQYAITINAKDFLQGKIDHVIVKAGVSSGFVVNPKNDVNVCKIGDDAKFIVGYSGYKIAYLDKSGKHGFAIKYDEYSDFTCECDFFPSIIELRMMYDNRYVLGLSGEYWSSTMDSKRVFSGDLYKTFDFSTGTTKIKKTLRDKCHQLHIKRF